MNNLEEHLWCKNLLYINRVGTLEEFVNENHAIVSSSVGPESYAGIMSFVDKD